MLQTVRSLALTFYMVESFKFSSSPGTLAHDPGNRILADVIKGSQHKILLNFRCALNPANTLGAGTESHTVRGHVESAAQRLGR